MIYSKWLKKVSLRKNLKCFWGFSNNFYGEFSKYWTDNGLRRSFQNTNISDTNFFHIGENRGKKFVEQDARFQA